MTDDDDITTPLWRCKKCRERFEDPIEMPGRTVASPGAQPRHVKASNHCPYCRSEDLKRWK